jgi:hypothetical protein
MISIGVSDLEFKLPNMTETLESVQCKEDYVQLLKDVYIQPLYVRITCLL